MIYTGCDLQIAIFLLLSLSWTNTRRHHQNATTHRHHLQPSAPLAIKRATCGHDLRGQDGGAAWQWQQPPAKISRPKRPRQDLPPKTPAQRSPAQNSRADRPCSRSSPSKSEERRGRGRGACRLPIGGCVMRCERKGAGRGAKRGEEPP